MARKLLIRTPNHLGDCLMALPMINDAGEVYSGATVTLLTPMHLAELFHQNPAVDDILELPREQVHGLMAVVKVKDMIAAHEFDIGYILPPSFGAAAGFKLGGVKERVGYIADGRRLLLTRPLALPAPLNETHRSELYYNLLRRGAGVSLEFTRPKLFLNDADTERGARLLDQFGVSASVEYGCIAFRAVAASRRWGFANYQALIKKLITECHLKVVLIGSGDDRPEGDALAESTSTKEVVNLAGKASLREAAAILSQARVFVGNDSGPAHLAAAVGAPVVVLSGADDPAATSPLATRKRLLYAEDLDCISCVKNKCPLKGEAHMQCLARIGVEDVVDRVRELLEEG